MEFQADFEGLAVFRHHFFFLNQYKADIRSILLIYFQHRLSGGAAAAITVQDIIILCKPGYPDQEFYQLDRFGGVKNILQAKPFKVFCAKAGIKIENGWGIVLCIHQVFFLIWAPIAIQ